MGRNKPGQAGGVEIRRVRRLPLSLLDCEDELLEIAEAVEIAYFSAATRATVKGPYDISCRGLGDDAPPTPSAPRIRRASAVLVTIGRAPRPADPGPAQLRRRRRLRAGRLPLAAMIETLGKSTPITDHVFVDFELRGCPINKGQLVELISAFLNGRKPAVPDYSLCLECKRLGNLCVMVAHGAPCLGPVTQAGCGALCPACNRPCYGCFGPKRTPNTAALGQWWRARQEMSEEELVRAFRGFNAWAEAFRRASESHEQTLMK